MKKNPFEVNTYGWFAYKDYLHAKFLFTNSTDEEFYESILVSCHQFVEKILKHMIQINGEIPPNTHSLKKLINECVNYYPDIKEISSEVNQLSSYYFDKRYPGENFYITNTEEVIESITSLDVIKDYIYEIILK